MEAIAAITTGNPVSLTLAGGGGQMKIALKSSSYEPFDDREDGRLSYFPVGTRRLSFSNQFWIRIISVTGVGFLSSSFIMRNRCPSSDRL